MTFGHLCSAYGLTRFSTSAAPTFFLELEDDPIKNNELSAGTDPLGEITNLQAGDEHGPRPYLSFICSTIQIVKPGRVLVVWHANFHPGLGQRFRNASIGCKFSKSANSEKVLSVIGHAPRRAYGGSSKESRNVHWGIELPLSFPAGPLSTGVTPSGSLETSKDVEHTFTITGTARGVPKKMNCVWTIEENTSVRRGVPSEMCFAALLEYEEPFTCEVSVSGRTGGIFSRWLRTCTPAKTRQKVIDPHRYRGLLKEYDFEADLSKCETMLQKWTGEVEGAVVQFSQPVLAS